MALVDNTPELSRYAKDMWLRHEKALAQAILRTVKNPLSQCQAEAVAHSILDAFQRALRAPDPDQALGAQLRLLANGWPE